MDIDMAEIEKTFEKLGINTTENKLTNLYPLTNNIPKTYQIRLDNVSKELSED